MIPFKVYGVILAVHGLMCILAPSTQDMFWKDPHSSTDAEKFLFFGIGVLNFIATCLIFGSNAKLPFFSVFCFVAAVIEAIHVYRTGLWSYLAFGFQVRKKNVFFLPFFSFCTQWISNNDKHNH